MVTAAAGIASAGPEIVRLFPTFVWRCVLGPAEHEPINTAILAVVDGLRRDLPPLAPAQAWQSGHALHQVVSVAGLVSRIRWAAERVLEFLRVGSTELRITGCWANVNATGAVHRMHTHPNNFLSGVYYVQAFAGADTINFHDPRSQTGIIRPPVTELTAYNTDQVVLTVKPGTLILFPAWLPHSVDANRSDRDRVSVSFNLMFSSYAETVSGPLWGTP
jgi:uncharacterized protein (TIGR02466 family)